MKKIGLFLGSDPYQGGTFQYNLSIIEALIAIQKNNYEIIIFYTIQNGKVILRIYPSKKYLLNILLVIII